jgi:hypothetical protein
MGGKQSSETINEQIVVGSAVAAIKKPVQPKNRNVGKLGVGYC